MGKYIIIESQFMYELLQRFQIAQVTFKLAQGHSHSYDLIGHI